MVLCKRVCMSLAISVKSAKEEEGGLRDRALYGIKFLFVYYVILIYCRAHCSRNSSHTHI